MTDQERHQTSVVGPCCHVICYASCSSGMLSSCGKDDFLNFTIKIVEASLFLMRRRTAETGLPVTQHIFIFDLKNFSLAAATHTATIDLLRKLITIYEGGERGGLQSYFLVFLNEIYSAFFFTKFMIILFQKILGLLVIYLLKRKSSKTKFAKTLKSNSKVP